MPFSRFISVLHMPKSAKCTCPCESSITLSSFRSLKFSFFHRKIVQSSEPVDDGIQVQKLQPAKNFCGVETRAILFELYLLLNVVHEIATVVKVHDEE